MSDLLSWLQDRRDHCSMTFEPIEFTASKEWEYRKGKLVHHTGGFFSIGGLIPTAAMASFDERSQPIILQPEVGVLGFLIYETEKSFEWLMQAKAEPGNTERVQLAPTVQATYSNYMRKHGGGKTHYLSYFQGGRPTIPCADSLHSEQGTRFLNKFNRNSTQIVDARLSEKSNLYKWFSSAEVRQVLSSDFAVNTDARSVIVTSPWSLIASNKDPFSAPCKHDSFMALCRASYTSTAREKIDTLALELLQQERERLGLVITDCSLASLPGWDMHDGGLDCKEGNEVLTVRYFDVSASEREKPQWDQPLVQSFDEGQVALFCQIRQGALHVFLRFSHEIGLTGGVEFGPSYQSESRISQMRQVKAFMDKLPVGPLLSVMQSDEGGRFMKSVSRYSIYLLSGSDEMPHDASGMWVNLSELEQMCRTPKLLTNEARSCISLLLSYS